MFKENLDASTLSENISANNSKYFHKKEEKKGPESKLFITELQYAKITAGGGKTWCTLVSSNGFTPVVHLSRQ